MSFYFLMANSTVKAHHAIIIVIGFFNVIVANKMLFYRVVTMNLKACREIKRLNPVLDCFWAMLIAILAVLKFLFPSLPLFSLFFV